MSEVIIHSKHGVILAQPMACVDITKSIPETESERSETEEQGDLFNEVFKNAN